MGNGQREWLRKWVKHKMILLLIGGMIGTGLRYLLGRWFNNQPWGQNFPIGTMFINVTGSFVLGVAGAIILDLERLPPDWFLPIGTGFCGGYTTFSTFEWETFRLVRLGSWWYAMANVFGSVLAGFAGVWLGVTLVGLVFPRK